MDRTTYVNDLHARYAIADPVIVTVVERATGRKVATTERLIRGDENEVHRVRLDDDSLVYLRVAWPGSPAKKTHDEVWAMEQARDVGVPAPEVLACPMIESADGERAGMVLRECARPAARSGAAVVVGRIAFGRDGGVRSHAPNPAFVRHAGRRPP
jgi:aminoglycoside phosphotransferase (APT) family kinase protein